jgi:hypothetical protein
MLVHRFERSKIHTMSDVLRNTLASINRWRGGHGLGCVPTIFPDARASDR